MIHDRPYEPDTPGISTLALEDAVRRVKPRWPWSMRLLAAGDRIPDQDVSAIIHEVRIAYYPLAKIAR